MTVRAASAVAHGQTAIPSTKIPRAVGVGARHALPPLFRWPGGKRWLVPRLLEFIPPSYGRYFEPFFGAGALFFALSPSSATISDANSELMACYRAVRQDSAQIGKVLRAMGRDETAYYQYRESEPTDSVERAARFIYLSTLAFNGIHRVNKQGRFNVPYGGRTYPDLGSDAVLGAYARALSSAEIESGDFEACLAAATAGDLVYLDPPYTVAHSNNGFLKYNARIFSWSDQERLATLAAQLHRRGCHVIISNAFHPSLPPLYPDFAPVIVSRMSRIAASPSSRSVNEYVFTNGS